MKRIAAYFKNRICLWLLPLLLTTAVGSVLIDCYATGNHALLKASYFLFALSAFILFDRLHKLRFWGGLLYTVLFVLVTVLAMRQVFMAEYMGKANISFQQWFYGIDVNNATAAVPYFTALFIGGGFFINSVLYYFTQVQYRALGTLLIIFIPFVIYAKRDDVVSDLSVTLIITLFIAIIVHNRIFITGDNGKGTVVNTAYVMSIALFVSAAGALAMIFPDFSRPSRLERDSSFLNFAGINAGGSKTLNNSDSSTRFHGVEYTNEPIFYVYPENIKEIEYPIYLRRRSMNAYDAKRLDWYVSKDLKGESGLYSTLDVAFPSLYAAERQKGLDELLPVASSVFEKMISEQIYGFELEFEKSIGTVPYIPAPLYSEVQLDDGSSVPMAESDMYSLSPALNSKNMGMVSITAVNCKRQAEEFAQQAGGYYADFAKTTAAALDAANERGSRRIRKGDDSDSGNELEEYMAEYYYGYYDLVQEYYHYSPSYLKERGLKDYEKIKDLADEICKDCKSDYEKAKAIEQYFTDAGFEYDLDYIPKDESISYFLFESKRGICIDFASAMGVMLIMENVPCRYVEGFVAYERDPEDSSRLIVRDSHAHAFVEAFIPYAGWMTFDPTVEGYMRTIDSTGDGSNKSMFTIILAYMGRILLVMGVLFVLVFIILFDRIWELVFRARLKLLPPDQKLTRLYHHIVGLLEYEDKTDLEPYTPKLLNDYLRKKTGSSLAAVTSLYESHRFGGREVSEEQFETAFNAYKELYPKIRKKGTQIGEQLTANS